jgi:branched-chain amino acid aminotransferase
MPRIDQMEGYIWLNGEFVRWQDAKIHVLTSALHYAGSVFEGERSYGGKVFKIKEHSERLLNSARIMDLELKYTVDEINDIVYKTLEKNNLKDAYIRPLVWKGSDALGVKTLGVSTNFMVATWDWPGIRDENILKNGISLCWADWLKPDPRTEPVEAKASGLYMIGSLAENKAVRNGYDDALFKDYRGYIAECSGSNVFFTINGELHTPTVHSSLNGITRQTILQLAREKNYRTYVRNISPEELENVQEVFICGTHAEITPVGKIENRIFVPGKITKDLRDTFLNLVNSK